MRTGRGGVEAEQLRDIFQLFMQVDQAATRAQGGLGIGLTLVKNLVELRGGSVHAQCPGLGHGSEFIVRLPIAAKVLQPVENNAPSQVENTVSTCQVLVVDDNRDAANSLALLLRTLGHDAEVANSGEEAIELIERHSPKVVFLDIGMPGMDGFEVARRLRADPAKADLCLAALTGWGQAEDRRKTAEAGFNHHIVKPPEMQTILKVLSQANAKQ